MKTGRKRPARKKSATSAKPPPAGEVRQAIAEYIDDQRKLLKKLFRKLSN